MAKPPVSRDFRGAKRVIGIGNKKTVTMRLVYFRMIQPPGLDGFHWVAGPCAGDSRSVINRYIQRAHCAASATERVRGVSKTRATRLLGNYFDLRRRYYVSMRKCSAVRSSSMCMFRL